jgi:hypothetical protein
MKRTGIQEHLIHRLRKLVRVGEGPNKEDLQGIWENGHFARCICDVALLESQQEMILWQRTKTESEKISTGNDFKTMLIGTRSR